MKNCKISRFFVLIILIAALSGISGHAQRYESKAMGISFELNGTWEDVSNEENFLFRNPSEDFELVLISSADLGNDVSPDVFSDEDFLSIMNEIYSLESLTENIEQSNPGIYVTATQTYQTHSRETIGERKFFRHEKVVTFSADGYNDKEVYYISYLTTANGKIYEFHYERPGDVNNYYEFNNLLNTLSFENDKIKIKINGETIYPDSDPVIIDGRTLVPIRAVAEKMGYSVGWDGEKQLVTLTSNDGNRILHFAIGLYEGLENYETPIPLDVPPTIFASRTYLPLRAVAEAMKANVDWEGDTRTVIITY